MSEIANKKERLWTVPFLMVILLNLFNGAAGQMSYPLVAKFTMSLGGDLSTASTAAGLMSLASLFVCPFAGLLSDLFPRRRILQISSVGYAICLFLHLMASTVPVLMGLRLLTGVFFSVNSVTAVAFSTSFIPKKRMGEGLGYASLANILAQAVGPGIGLFLAEHYGFWANYLAAGLCALICLLMITLFPKESESVRDASADGEGSKEKKKIRPENLFAPQLTAFMLVAVLFSWGSSFLSTYLALIGDERQIAGIALFFTVYSLFMVVLRPVSGKLFDKKGVYVMVIPALAFTAVGLFLIGNAMTLPLILIASGFMAIGQGAGVPSIQAHSIKYLGQERAGVAVSTVQIGQNLGNAVGPMIGGLLVKPLGYKGMFSLLGGVIFVLGTGLTLIQRTAEKHSNEKRRS